MIAGREEEKQLQQSLVVNICSPELCCWRGCTELQLLFWRNWAKSNVEARQEMLIYANKGAGLISSAV